MANGNTVSDLNLGGETDLTGFYQGIMGALAQEQEKADQQQLQYQKQVQADNKQISDLIGKVNPEGIRTVDTGLIASEMDKVRDIAYKYYTADNESDRMKYRAEIQQGLLGVSSTIDKSKQFVKASVDYGKDYAKSPFLYSTDTVDKIKRLQSAPLSELNTEDIAPTNFTRVVDTTKVLDRVYKIGEELVKRTDLPEQTVTNRLRVGNQTQTGVTSIKEVPMDAYLTRLNQEYQSNPELKALIAQQYPDVSPQEGLSAIAQQAYDLGYLTESKTRYVTDRAPRTSNTSGSRASSDEDATFNTVQDFGQGNSFVAPVQLPTKADNISITNVRGVDLTTGRPTQPLSGKVDATGLMKVPVLTQDVQAGGVVIPKGSIATQDFATSNPGVVEESDFFIGNLEQGSGLLQTITPILIPRERFPKTTKRVENDVNTFDRVSQGYQTQPTQQQSQTVTQTETVAERMRRLRNQ